MQQILNRPAIKAEAKSFIGQNARWWKMTLATIAIYLISGGFSIYVNIATVTKPRRPFDNSRLFKQYNYSFAYTVYHSRIRLLP